MTETFYSRLKPRDRFQSAFQSQFYHGLPEDWWIALSDVRGSTAAIAKGQYRNVNLVGAATVIAVVNALKDIEVPYVFGGDGATLLVPGTRLDVVRGAMAGARKMARDSFGLELRVALVSMKEVLEAGLDVGVLKMKLSETVSQSMLSGGGIGMAEKWVKDPVTADAYAIPMDFPAQADFEGLECRWNPVKNQHGEIVSLIIKSRVEDFEEQNAHYLSILKKIDEIYGKAAKPIRANGLKLALNPKKLMGEIGVKQKPAKAVWGIWFFNVLWVWVFKLGLKLFGIDWGRYFSEIPTQSDDRKFDETLRMILDGSKLQRDTLLVYLESQYEKGRLFYGIHVAREALLTCLVFDRNGRHLHFVDGNDGGYTEAARGLKKQIAGAASPAET